MSYLYLSIAIGLLITGKFYCKHQEMFKGPWLLMLVPLLFLAVITWPAMLLILLADYLRTTQKNPR